jgi:hypothetical protein
VQLLDDLVLAGGVIQVDVRWPAVPRPPSCCWTTRCWPAACSAKSRFERDLPQGFAVVLAGLVEILAGVAGTSWLSRLAATR